MLRHLDQALNYLIGGMPCQAKVPRSHGILPETLIPRILADVPNQMRALTQTSNTSCIYAMCYEWTEAMVLRGDARPRNGSGRRPSDVDQRHPHESDGVIEAEQPTR